jgi:hypothetical protein
MKHQKGYSTTQIALLAAVAGLFFFVAVPRYSALIEQTRVQEAYHLVSASKMRVAEFYIMSDRLPETELEVEAVTTDILTPPEFVSSIVVESESGSHDITLKVYFTDDAVDHVSGSGEQFIFLAADRTDSLIDGLEWSCGAHGIDTELLPSDCRG